LLDLVEESFDQVARAITGMSWPHPPAVRYFSGNSSEKKVRNCQSGVPVGRATL
jgi:hypothetical protein